VVLGSYGSPKVTENSAIPYSEYEFLIAFHSNGGFFGSYGSPKVTENSAIPYSEYEFLIAFRSNYVQGYLAPFLRYARY